MKESNPLISFIVLTYNQEEFIHEAIQGALSQTYMPLEIIISDDNSQDNTYKIIKEITEKYDGPHKVIINRNEKNLGIGGHINHVMRLSSGKLIIASAGDDISLPDRTQKICDAYNASDGKAKILCSNGVVIDTNGEAFSYISLTDKHSNFITDTGVCNNMEQRLQFAKTIDNFTIEKFIEGIYIPPGCSHAWSKDIFDFFGPLLPPLTCEDHVIPFRGALLGEFVFIDECLVKYRQHSNHVLSKKINANSQKRMTLEFESIIKNWLRDLDILQKIKPEENYRIELLREKIKERHKIINNDIHLSNSLWIMRIIILIKNFLTGTPWPIIRKNIGIYLMPNIYNQYIKFRYSKKN